MPAVPLFPFHLEMHQKLDICPVKLHTDMPFAAKKFKKFLRWERSFSTVSIFSLPTLQRIGTSILKPSTHEFPLPRVVEKATLHTIHYATLTNTNLPK